MVYYYVRDSEFCGRDNVDVRFRLHQRMTFSFHRVRQLKFNEDDLKVGLCAHGCTGDNFSVEISCRLVIDERHSRFRVTCLRSTILKSVVLKKKKMYLLRTFENNIFVSNSNSNVFRKVYNSMRSQDYRVYKNDKKKKKK